MGFLARDSEPGDVLLFRRLSGSTIGAVWFHGRVRDGIGWGTDAMATKQWSRRKVGLIDAPFGCVYLAYRPSPGHAFGRPVVDGGILRYPDQSEALPDARLSMIRVIRTG